VQSGPLVSAVVIFLDCLDFLAEAIESVLSQTYRDWELLLVDDGSSDGSSELAAAYAAKAPERIRCLAHPGRGNRGMSASRNLGIRHARGKYIALLDGDDVWLPRKLERQVARMEAEPDVGMLFGLTEYWHGWSGRPEDAARDETPGFSLGGRTRFDPPALLTHNYPLGQGRAPCQCSLLLKADAVHRVGGFEESFTGFYEDQVFLSKIYLEERVAFLEECHDRYRVHERSSSAVVRREGRYHRYREQYLRWLGEHLTREGRWTPEIEETLSAALEPYRGRSGLGASTEWLRLLRVAEGGSARLELRDDAPDRVRIAIAQCGSSVPYDIQLNLPRLRARSGERYVLGFTVRADEERVIGVGFADGRSPWQNLGFYETVQVGPDWRHFAREFTVTRDQDDARIHFDVGGQAVSVEVSAISLVSLRDGAYVLPEVAGNRPGRGQSASPVQVGAVDFGDLRRLTPISPDFGCDRGRPVDRHYIEAFLAAHAEDVRGRVLEVGERTYTRRFGGDRVTGSDVLHVSEGEPEATIIADLTSAGHVPSEAFDCLIITQTLQLIYDLASAVRTMHRVLAPDGVALVTLPGISQTYDSEWGGSWYWNFTELSARRLFENQFGAGNVSVEAHGNVLAAISFLHGLAEEELSPAELGHEDPGYPVTIAVRAVKRSGSRPASPPARSAAAVRAPAAEAKRAGAPGALALLYHRVSSGHADPWSLCVTPGRFSEQLDWLGEHTTPMTLSELVAAVRRGEVPGNAVALTFDDGYADNLVTAAPLLRGRSVAATFFISVAPWPVAREEAVLDELRGALGRPARVRATHRRLTPQEIADLAGFPSVEIGGHTVTHPLLPAHSPADQLWEIDSNRVVLEGLAGRAVTSFAYPFGAWSDATIAQLRRAGFSSACTTEAAALSPGGDPFRVPRVAVGDWGAEELARRLRPWLNPADHSSARRSR
jgi:glycosyltransferase involved in cell wall biosynthesis/peptidoglycan/xylan/chitin deacetylase (PgdA/CDA1 family)